MTHSPTDLIRLNSYRSVLVTRYFALFYLSDFQRLILMRLDEIREMQATILQRLSNNVCETESYSLPFINTLDEFNNLNLTNKDKKGMVSSRARNVMYDSLYMLCTCIFLPFTCSYWMPYNFFSCVPILTIKAWSLMPFYALPIGEILWFKLQLR
jgi:hypothetical protein